MIRNLGTALSILARAEVREHILHDDVDAYGAPGECHDVVARGEARRSRVARKAAEAACKRPFRVIRREAKRRAGIDVGSPYSRSWNRLVGRIDARENPFWGVRS